MKCTVLVAPNYDVYACDSSQDTVLPQGVPPCGESSSNSKLPREGAPFYIALGLYIMPQWYHVNLDEPDEKLRWQMTRFEFYFAPTPWGPWTLFHTQENPKPQGWYNPYIPNKFISSDGRKFWIFTGGTGMDGNGGYESEFYALYMIPVTLEVES